VTGHARFYWLGATLKTDPSKQSAAVLQPNLAMFWLKPRQKAVFESFLMPVSGCSPINTGVTSYQIKSIALR
jgi:hypothetical protein